jgi:hypothetical protein
MGGTETLSISAGVQKNRARSYVRGRRTRNQAIAIAFTVVVPFYSTSIEIERD